MRSDTTSTGSLKPPPLNSDQLNYLIWRYLQESGYGEAAVKLQRDWKVEAENLPFAKHVKGQALISLVQKGLRYHHLALTIDENGQQTKRLDPAMYFFGPEDARPESSSRDHLIRKDESLQVTSPVSTSSALPRKRDPESNGVHDAHLQSAKRSRKGAPNGAASRKPSAPPNQETSNNMDVDSINGQDVARIPRSPSAGEGLPHDDGHLNGNPIDHQMDIDVNPSVLNPNHHHIPHKQPNTALPFILHTLTNGESVGVQVEPAKVRNLAPSAVVLSVAENSPVTRTAWRPNDWSKLTTSGHTFCGICPLTGPVANSHAPYRSLLSPDEANIVTAFAWASNGSLLAIATYAEQGGQIHVFDGSELALIETLPGSHRAITSLKWLPESPSLVGLVPGDDGDGGLASILTWDVAAMLQGQVTEPDTQEITSDEGLIDMDVAELPEAGLVYAAGRHAIYRYSFQSKGNIGDDQKGKDMKKLPSPVEHEGGWSFVRCRSKPTSEEVVVAASADSASLWLPHRNVYKAGGHRAPITGLELRPRAYHNNEAGSIPDFATSSIDGSIKIWTLDTQANAIISIQTLLLDRSSPIMAISFSPDGFCLGGASYDQVLIWNAEHGYNLMASWKGQDTEWRGMPLKEAEMRHDGSASSVNGDLGPDVSEHGLAWDTDSKKLAFGLGTQVAVIDFQR